MRPSTGGIVTALYFLDCHLGIASAAFDASAGTDHCHGYKASNVVETTVGLVADLDLVGSGCSVYGPDVAQLTLTVESEADSRLHVLIQDRKDTRYQVPEKVLPRPGEAKRVLSSENPLEFKLHSEPFSFKVIRKSSGEVLFDTSETPLIFERQYLSLTTWLPENPNVYGLGEHTDPFRLPTRDYTRTFWSRDAGAVPERENLYGNHPVYFEHRSSGTHGVFLVNSNGMDVVLDEDSTTRNYLQYRTIGGILDLYFLAGPSPVDVSRQYAALVGLPAMVPYWSLGLHQCRFGYDYWWEVAEVVHNYSAAGIPLETMWTDIDYMDRRRVFSLDLVRFPLRRMHDLIKYLRGRQQRYIVMVDPAVASVDYPAFTLGKTMDVFMKTSRSVLFRGVVWPGATVFPDWFHPNSTAYWTRMFHDFFNPSDGVDIDGVWIDMNEPANFCDFPCKDPEKEAKDQNFPPPTPPEKDAPRPIPGFPYSSRWDSIVSWIKRRTTLSQQSLSGSPEAPKSSVEVDHDGDDLLHPQYRIRNHAGSGDLSDRTSRTDVQHGNGQWEYDVHNLYGTLMSMATRTAMLARRPGLRPFIITRSTFAGAGTHVGKWLGDNVSKWDHYRASIPGMLNFASIFQMPMVGSDVCGFIGDTTEKLCARWATLGAFNPFYRNHNDDKAIPQEFYRWPLVAEAAKYGISVRYRLLDYFYTTLMQQSSDGTPALNPLWYLYPQDEATFPIDTQFFYGNCLLVSPVIGEDATGVSVYFPDDVFYDFETGKEVDVRGGWAQLEDIPYDRIPLHVRCGCILPMRTSSANTTTELRKKGFELLVAPGLDGKARGSLYVDDGESLDGGSDRTQVTFKFDQGQLSSVVDFGPQGLEMAGIRIERITVLGDEWATR